MKKLKLFFALFAMLALGVGNAWGATYTKVTSAPADWSGEYIVVYESDNTAYVWTGVDAAKCNTTATISNNSVTGDFVTVTIAPMTGGYSIKVNGGTNSGKYIYGASGSNKLNFGASAQLNTLSYETDWVKITSNTSVLTFNKASSDMRFRYYKAASYSAQQHIQLYKTSSGGSVTPDPITVTLDKSTLSLEEGENATLTATVNGSSDAVTWTSSAPTIATVDKGVVTALTAGETTITAAIGEVKATCTVTVTAAPFTPDPGAGEDGSYTWDLSKNTYTKGTDEVTWTADGIATMHNAGTNATNYLGGDSNSRSSSRFYSNNTLTITPAANVTITSVEFTATSSNYATTLKNSTWNNATASVSGSVVTVTPTNGASAISATVGGTCGFTGVTVHYTKAASGDPETPTPSVSVKPTSHTFATTNVGETATQEFTITAKNTTATLSASIDNTTDFAISAITGDKVTVTYQPKSPGDHTATMTVKAGEEASTTVALTGKAVAALEGTWILVTDASSLKAGDEIIIAAKEYDVALSTTQNNNNRGEVAITKNQNTITATSEAQVLTLQAGTKEGTLALSTGAGYLHAASSSANQLKTETELSDNSSWTIAVAADGLASLIAQGTYTHNVMQYNQSSKLFACYASASQKAIALYKNTNGQQLAGLAYATTKYLTKLGDAFTTPTLTNNNLLTVTYSSSDDNVATVAADGAVTIKAAGVVKITASFAGNASYLEGSASYTIGVTEHAGTQADPYSVADAKRVIDVMGTAENVYATGIISQIDSYNSTYNSITYWISADGTTTSQMQVYGGLAGTVFEKFTSKDNLKTGDEVVIKGNLKLHNGSVYEFDANNELVSLVRNKQQAGLAYAETELTANVGEDFAEPTLTNPNSLTVTYSSSNTALATVDATTGEVSILAAGKVTITASSAADATYAAGSASYNITITDPSLAIATLPFYFDGKRADIEGTAGMTQSKIGTDYADAPYLKFNTEGAWAIVQFDSEPGEFSFLLKQNGESIGTFTVYESENGEDYTPIWSGGDLGGNAKSATIEPTLSATARYVKFEYTTKPTGTNYGLGEISIKKADHRQEAGLVWSTENVSITLGDAFTAPTLSNPNGLSGITFASSNEELATVNNAGAITLVSGKTGTATITATFAGNKDYKAVEVTCTITVDHKSEDVVILAKCKDQYYALVAEYVTDKTDVLKALPVEYLNGKIYNVETEEQKASIIWKRVVVDGKTTFKNGDNYLSAINSAALKLATETCDWVFEGDMYKIEGSTRTILYYTSTGGFKNYATTNMSKDGVNGEYSSAAITVAPVFADGDAYHRTVTEGDYGTLCIPFGSNVGSYSGAEFYEISWMEMKEDLSEPKGIWLDEVNGNLTAGKPYIFKATADEIAIVGDGTTAASPIAGEAGLTGTFTLIQDSETNDDPSNKLEGNYMISGNQFLLCPAGCWLNANRAYIDATIIANHTTKKAKIPGRRRVCLGETSENEATGFENIVAPEGQAVKAIVNGQLIIIRDGVKYNVQGQRL